MDLKRPNVIHKINIAVACLNDNILCVDVDRVIFAKVDDAIESGAFDDKLGDVSKHHDDSAIVVDVDGRVWRVRFINIIIPIFIKSENFFLGATAVSIEHLEDSLSPG